MVGGVAELRRCARSDSDHLHLYALCLHDFDEALKVPVTGNQADNVQAIDHLHHVKSELNINVGFDRIVLEAFQRLGEHLVALPEERLDKALGLNAHPWVVMHGGVGNCTHQLAVSREHVEDLFPVEAGLETVTGEFDIRGVHEHADAGRRRRSGGRV